MTEVISLINEKGGVGKSTSAITIAQILAISEYKVLLIDLDPQMNTTKMYGQAEANPDIDYERLFCEKQKNKNEVMSYITETEYKNISILTASRELNSLIYKIYDKMKEVNVELYLRYNLNLIKDEFDYIIIDNSPFKSYLTSCAMCASDKIITPICVDNFSYDGLMSLFDTIEELNDKYALSIEFAGIFMTRTGFTRCRSCRTPIWGRRIRWLIFCVMARKTTRRITASAFSGIMAAAVRPAFAMTSGRSGL